MREKNNITSVSDGEIENLYYSKKPQPLFSEWKKLNIMYVCVTIFLCICFLIVNFFIPGWWKLVYSLPILFIFMLILSLKDRVLDLIPVEKRLAWGQAKEIKWKSLEFDEFVGDDLYTIYMQSHFLLHREKNSDYVYSFDDYSFVVLPAAKSYEGVLKKILVHIGLVTEQELLENPGMALNSYFDPVNNKSISSSLKDKARDRAVPHIIYSTYQECRNEILHYDSYRDNKITLDDAEFYIKRIDDAISKAYNTFIGRKQKK